MNPEATITTGPMEDMGGGGNTPTAFQRIARGRIRGYGFLLFIEVFMHMGKKEVQISPSDYLAEFTLQCRYEGV